MPHRHVITRTEGGGVMRMFLPCNLVIIILQAHTIVVAFYQEFLVLHHIKLNSQQHTN
jgi:hypothetical protein